MSPDSFPLMSTILEPKKGKCFEIRSIELSKEDLEFMQLRDMMSRRREFYGQKPGTYIQLVDLHGAILMSDTEMERRTNRAFLMHAHGDILTAGLGLGMILLAAQEKPEVKSITAVELYQEVIDLVAPQLPLNGKTTIICGDIFEWLPEAKEARFDTIYFDIWEAFSADNYEDMKKLNRRFGRRLNRNNPNCWMSSWRHRETKRSYLENHR